MMNRGVTYGTKINVVSIGCVRYIDDMKLWYVIDKNKKYVTHQGDESSCHEYIRTVGYLYGLPSTNYVLADSAKSRDVTLRLLKK
jgi:hypothetical protein